MSISIEAHDRICQDLHQQIRSLIVENEKLRAALEQPEQEPVAKSTWQKLYEAAIDQRNEAVALNQELLEALKECLPYVGQTLANTGSMDAYYTEAKACAAINAAERNT